MLNIFWKLYLYNQETLIQIRSLVLWFWNFLHTHTYIHTHTHTYIYIYIYIIPFTEGRWNKSYEQKETVAAITILYRNAKAKVRSPDGDTEYFDIAAGVLQGDTLAPHLFIIYLDYVLRTSIDKIKENGFELTEKISRRYLAKTITDADYADDIAILANTLTQAEALLHSLEQATSGIGLHVNARKTNKCALIKQATFPH